MRFVLYRFGRSVEGFNIDEFRLAGGADYAPRFGHRLEVQVPFGTYHVSASRAGFRDFEATVEVLAKSTLVTICFETPAMEDEAGGRIVTSFAGRFEGGQRAAGRGGFCKASGVYLRLQYEAVIRVADAGFDFGLVALGSYTINCHLPSGEVVVRELKVDGDAKPFVLDIATEAGAKPERKQR